MNKDQFNSALDKIRATEEFKEKVLIAAKGNSDPKKTVKNIKLLPVAAAVIVMITLGIFYIPLLFQNNNTAGFKIIGQMQGEASYISVVYLYGYAYSPNDWLSYSRGNNSDEQNFEAGDKLGEVTLDLKGLRYTGTPPDFSSTYDVGTEIYEIKNVKKDRAILVRSVYGEDVFYRERKYMPDENEPIDLTIAEVFQMVTDQMTISAVELRSGEDGSWMRTSVDSEVISLINKELPEQNLLSRKEIGKEIDDYRVSVNLMFEDGAALNIQFYPRQQFAYFFGGYINISEELAEEITRLNLQGEMYDKITDLLPDTATKITYLYIKNHVDGNEVLCKDPEWSGRDLFDQLKYYRIKTTDQSNARQLIMTIKAGSSEDDYTEIGFYEDDLKNIIIQINGKNYETVMGHIRYENLENFLINHSD